MACFNSKSTFHFYFRSIKKDFLSIPQVILPYIIVFCKFWYNFSDKDAYTDFELNVCWVTKSMAELRDGGSWITGAVVVGERWQLPSYLGEIKCCLKANNNVRQ